MVLNIAFWNGVSGFVSSAVALGVSLGVLKNFNTSSFRIRPSLPVPLMSDRFI